MVRYEKALRPAGTWRNTAVLFPHGCRIPGCVYELWAERDVYLSDIMAMIYNQDEQAKLSSTELPENYIVGVIK